MTRGINKQISRTPSDLVLNMLKHVRRCKSVIKHQSSTCILSDEEFKNEPDRKEPRARTRTPRRGGVETDSKPKKEKNKEEKKKRNKEMDSTELTAERSRLIQTKKKKIMRTETTDQCPKIIRSLCVCSENKPNSLQFSSVFTPFIFVELAPKKWYATTC